MRYSLIVVAITEMPICRLEVTALVQPRSLVIVVDMVRADDVVTVRPQALITLIAVLRLELVALLTAQVLTKLTPTLRFAVIVARRLAIELTTTDTPNDRVDDVALAHPRSLEITGLAVKLEVVPLVHFVNLPIVVDKARLHEVTMLLPHDFMTVGKVVRLEVITLFVAHVLTTLAAIERLAVSVIK